MKTTILLLLISTLSIGQSYNWDSIALETQKKLDRNESIVDSISRMEVMNAIKFKENLNIKLCEERGHLITQGITVTLAYCPPYLIDTDTTTIIVYPVCNWADDYCERCGKHFPSSQKEVRETIWKKENK